jgi:hypothetical protein
MKGDTQEVKEKFETAVFEANVTNYAFTTNTVPSRLFEADDRRFLVLQHDGTRVQDVPYLSSLRLAMKEGAEDFFLFHYENENAKIVLNPKFSFSVLNRC